MEIFQVGGFKLKVLQDFDFHSATFVAPAETTERAFLTVFKRKLNFRPNLHINRAEENNQLSNVAAYVDSQMKLLEEFAGFRQIHREVLPNGDVLQHHSFDNQEGIHIEQLQRYLATSKGIFIATCSHVAGELFAAHAAKFREVLLAIE